LACMMPNRLNRTAHTAVAVATIPGIQRLSMNSDYSVSGASFSSEAVVEGKVRDACDSISVEVFFQPRSHRVRWSTSKSCCGSWVHAAMIWIWCSSISVEVRFPPRPCSPWDQVRTTTHVVLPALPNFLLSLCCILLLWSLSILLCVNLSRSADVIAT